jgi:Kdo2-lipid IVA lauroyltransferase/acyltransferase
MIKRISSLFTSIFFFFFVFIIGIMPFGLMYVLSDILAWLLRKVFRYRYKVVEENLKKSDLNLSDEQIQTVIAKIYRNLADILLEGIKSFTIGQKQILKRHKVINPEIVEPFYDTGKSIILVTGHLGNWEWGSLSAGMQTPYNILAFYKPLKNKYIDKFLRYSRARFGTTLASIRKTSLSFGKMSDQPTLFLMAADQNPSKVGLAYWTPFLGRDTAFLHGPEKHARINNLPLIFAEIDRKKRGYYEIWLSVIVEQPNKLPEGEITCLYAKKLDTAIRSNPSNWLWTHKRWKHIRQ